MHEGKQPNPIEVILSTQRFVCRFREAHNKEHLDRRMVPKNGKVSTSSSSTGQLLIKISSNRNRKTKRLEEMPLKLAIEQVLWLLMVVTVLELPQNCWRVWKLWWIGMAIYIRSTNTWLSPTLMGRILSGPIRNRVGYGLKKKNPKWVQVL